MRQLIQARETAPAEAAAARVLNVAEHRGTAPTSAHYARVVVTRPE
jgi:hypothetical protein